MNAWAKQAVLLCFRVRRPRAEAGPFEYHDRLPLKHGYEEQGVRVVRRPRALRERIWSPASS